MTSPSRKKHPTIRRSIRPAITHNTGLRLAVLCAALLLVTSPGQSADDHPLDQLRERSAERRWKSLRERLAERRADRKDRKDDEDIAAGDTAADPQIADEPEKTGETISYPLPPSAQPDWQQAPVASQPPVAPPQRPAPVPTMATPAPVPAPNAPAGRATVSHEGSLYQELFQLDAKPETGVAASTQTPAAQPFSAGPEAAPHPGTMTATSTRTATSNGETPSLTVSHPKPMAAPRSATPGLLPRLPLPSAPAESEFRTAQNQPRPGTTGRGLNTEERPLPRPEPLLNLNPDRQSIDDYLYSEADYIKKLDQIAPFADYEPDPDIRESDPYRNLCPHPHGDSDEFLCPVIDELPGSDVHTHRQFAHLDYPWAAPNLCYYPLYFEDVNTERYGHFHRPLVQPFVSVGKFSVQFLGLPYQMAMHQPAQPTYPLGYFRPGDVGAPKLYYQVPINFKAAVATVGVYTGWFFVIP